MRAYFASPVNWYASSAAMMASLCGHQNYMSCQYSATGPPSTSVK
jgi:hypothetical protein